MMFGLETIEVQDLQNKIPIDKDFGIIHLIS